MRSLAMQCKTLDQARERAPWASVIVSTPDGFYAWECLRQYNTYRGQRSKKSKPNVVWYAHQYTAAQYRDATTLEGTKPLPKMKKSED